MTHTPLCAQEEYMLYKMKKQCQKWVHQSNSPENKLKVNEIQINI